MAFACRFIWTFYINGVSISSHAPFPALFVTCTKFSLPIWAWMETVNGFHMRIISTKTFNSSLKQANWLARRNEYECIFCFKTLLHFLCWMGNYFVAEKSIWFDRCAKKSKLVSDLDVHKWFCSLLLSTLSTKYIDGFSAFYSFQINYCKYYLLDVRL